ncbi:AraC family transcriptional regulator [Paenibacillus sp. CF384]|uniref:helix-turn-helix domain-containing protein n=1 Tax=Paenibacillus sp. CF384 TaxID=1884382 RepID=UPI00089C6B4F|nr:AraC family transcriptional regulator [Paenibacillus sp. CF384]SDW16657.1 Helix-turn-helix domain-containing protein [Paenibacillus sp. CF384]
MKIIGRLLRFPYIRTKSPSLFFWLLISYMTIVILLVSFILYSVFFYRGTIKEEVIAYNNVNLNNTMENYEAKFQLIENAALSFSLNDHIAALDKPKFDYAAGSKLMNEIQIYLANQSLFLENMIVYFKKSNVAIEKTRGADADVMFKRYYVSKTYGYEFWQSQFDNHYVTRILPNDVFSELEYNAKRTSERKLIPIIIKNQTNPSVYIIALADAQKMYKAFHQSITNDFYILDDAQRSFFTTVNNQQLQFPALEGSHGYVKKDSNYYFYKKGELTGLTYINVIPDDSIVSQMKWNITFVMLLVLSILFSMLVSFLFSMRFNRPVKQLVQSIQQLTTGFHSQKHSGIKEFAFIQERVRHLLDSNFDISQNLEEKNSLLRHYAYINQLKNIRNNTSFLKDLIQNNQPYRVVLFKLTFRPQLLEEIDDDEERATLFIRAYIDKILTERYPDSLTLQLESDQLLSVIYSDQAEHTLAETLDGFRIVLDLDRAYCFSTMAVSKRYEHADDFNLSFEQTKSLLLHRKFNDRNQVLWAETDSRLVNYFLMSAQEEEITASLNNGNESQLVQFMKREIAGLRKKEATEHEVKAFINIVVERTKRAYNVNHLDTELLQSLQTSLQHSHTFEELEQLFEEWLPSITNLIKSKKEKKDHITSFVFDYLENHYAHDITLDMMADKLNITRSYLSTYFKEKTGTYFVDYVNLIRVSRAKELLSRSDVKIQDAAARVGYQNINSFNRMFKKFTGVTPSEFRKVERV